MLGQRSSTRRWLERRDSTAEEVERAHRGRHFASTGTCSYPAGDGRRGTRYMRCTCGWRIVGIYDLPKGAELQRAQAQFSDHVESMSSNRRQPASEARHV